MFGGAGGSGLRNRGWRNRADGSAALPGFECIDAQRVGFGVGDAQRVDGVEQAADRELGVGQFCRLVGTDHVILSRTEPRGSLLGFPTHGPTPVGTVDGLEADDDEGTDAADDDKGTDADNDTYGSEVPVGSLTPDEAALREGCDHRK